MATPPQLALFGGIISYNLLHVNTKLVLEVSGFKPGKIFRFPGINMVWLTGYSERQKFFR
jgi:hypothetical protein